MTQRFTCGTVELGAADAARVGGKAAALGELARAGLPVPRGFVITTAAFLLHMDGVDPDGAAAGRGAYACSNEACLAKALAGGRLAHALRGSSQPPAESAAVILETWRRR